MISKESLSVFQSFLSSKKAPMPSLHVVLGSGFGAALEHFPGDWENLGDLSFAKVPGIHASTVPDHAGAFRFYRYKDKVISFQMGRLHGYEGHEPSAVVGPVMLARFAGAKDFLLTNASGGLSLSYKPGDVMLIRDQVNLTGKNPLIGPNPKDLDGKEMGPRFPDMINLYDRVWRENLSKHCKAQGLNVHEGTYLGILGPSFETPSEVNLFASWGMGAVGMSTVWEAIALRHSGAKVCGMSLISNLGAGMGSGEPLDHMQIIETCRASASKIAGAIRASIEEGVGAKA